MNYEMASLLQSIEKLRNEMVDAYKHNSIELTHPDIVRLSQLLDYQLNSYQAYKNKVQSAS